MNRYLVLKQGWQFLDLAKAYGVGTITYALSGDAEISDAGAYYEVRTQKELDFSRIPKIQEYLGDDLEEWGYALATLNKAKVEKLKQEIRKFFSDENNVRKLLSGHLGGKSVTLPQSLELAASKGIRKAVPSSYSEDQVKILQEEFYLAVLGAINVSLWKYSKEYWVAVYPLPSNTKIRHIYTIRSKLKDSVKGFHRAGYFATVAYIAARLVKEEKALRNGGKFSPKIGGLLYGVMMKTGNQPKPFTSGLFPLELLHTIVVSNEDTLDMWLKIFEFTSFKKGYEDLALSLAKFIAEPTLDNYYSYARLHLRNELRKESLKFGVYDADSLLEVLKHVEVS